MEKNQAVQAVAVNGRARARVGTDPAPDPVTDDAAVAARRARFGRLPERIRFEDMVQAQVAPKDPARDAYQAAGSFVSYSCLALDLGL